LTGGKTLGTDINVESIDIELKNRLFVSTKIARERLCQINCCRLFYS
jgi:hypothetical protein